MVAAWMRADTGVGPSIASGSHTYSGICADLPVAPMNISSVISEMVPKVTSTGISFAASAMVVKSSELKVTTSSSAPRRNAKSPMRLTTNAFLAASEADFFS